MFGFFIGTACLVGLVAIARRPRHRFGPHGRLGGRRFLLRRALGRLDTTPGQEKVIRSAVHDFEEEAYTLRGDLSSTRAELAGALRGQELDKSALDRIFQKHDELIEKLRASFVRALDQVHGTLDERQRQELAEMLEGGRWSRVGC